MGRPLSEKAFSYYIENHSEVLQRFISEARLCLTVELFTVGITIGQRYEPSDHKGLFDVSPIYLIKWIADQDPSPNTIYTKWVLGHLIRLTEADLAATFKFSLLTRVLKDLATFTAVKPFLPVVDRDINRFTFEGLVSLIESLDDIDTTSRKQVRRRYEDHLVATGQATLIYDDATYKVVSLHSLEASMFYGRHTRWCTTERGGQHFETTIMQGPLYVLIFKAQNLRWQFHFESEQVRDSANDMVSREEVRNCDIVQTLFGGHFLDMPGWVFYHRAPSVEAMVSAVKRNPSWVAHVPDTLDEEGWFDLITQAPDALAFSERRLTDEQLDHVVTSGSIIPIWSVLRDSERTIERLNAAFVHVPGMIRFIFDPTSEQQWSAVNREPASITHIDRATDDMWLYALAAQPTVGNLVTPSVWERWSRETRDKAIALWPSLRMYDIERTDAFVGLSDFRISTKKLRGVDGIYPSRRGADEAPSFVLDFEANNYINEAYRDVMVFATPVVETINFNIEITRPGGEPIPEIVPQPVSVTVPMLPEPVPDDATERSGATHGVTVTSHRSQGTTFADVLDRVHRDNLNRLYGRFSEFAGLPTLVERLQRRGRPVRPSNSDIGRRFIFDYGAFLPPR